MRRDGLAWAVDLGTVVVGGTAVVTLVYVAIARRTERRRYEEAWSRQLALDHHARIYSAAADLIRAITVLTGRAPARIGVRGRARASYGYSDTADETVDDEYAAFLDRLGDPVAGVHSAHAEAMCALHGLWLLSPRGERGDRLLEDLVSLSQLLEAAKPCVGQEAGRGDLEAALDANFLRQQVEMVVSTDFLGPITRCREPRSSATLLRDTSAVESASLYLRLPWLTR